jgi:DNA-3-methyladenine glycosylase
MKLDQDFYLRDDVVKIAEELLGKVIFTRENRIITAGIITETEAYNGIVDRASHAYGERRTGRTEIMYRKGGVAYVYLCYGIHSLFNVVTNVENVPHAVLIRAIQPLKGSGMMMSRRNISVFSKSALNGPGKVSEALNIHYSDSGLSLLGNKIWIEDLGYLPEKDLISITPRIGVDYAGKDALLPYRFVYNGLFKTSDL